MWKLQSKSSLITIVIIAVAYYEVRKINSFPPSPIVSLSTGRVQGSVGTSRNGRDFFQFLGIPFAQPPVGALRFESPRPALPWNGTLDGTRNPPACKGFDFFLRGRAQGEEDCLFLNVQTPVNVFNKSGTTFRTGSPVLVHIHGGGFHMGSAAEFPGSYFMDEDVVLVTVQYRLGIFGFLNLNGKAARGNMGLKDQTLALKWVKANIAKFGGDPNQVTIIGHSAGGVSAHLHMLSKMSKGLFQRAISFSVDALSDLIQLNRNNMDQILYTANHFNCPSEPAEALVKCLRAIDADKLTSIHEGFTSPRMFRNWAGFAPSLETVDDEEAFLTEQPLKLLDTGRIESKVPLMVGVNQNEGLLIIGKFIQSVQSASLLQSDEAWEKLVPHILVYNSTLRPDAAKKIREHFFGSKTYSVDDNDALKTLGNIVTEKIFHHAVSRTAQLQSKVSPVYIFENSYESVVSVFDFLRWAEPESALISDLVIALKFIRYLIERFVFGLSKYSYGTAHGDEILLLYDIPYIPKFLTNEIDLEMSQQLVKTVTDFAHLSKPVKFKGLDWPCVEENRTLNIAHFKHGEPEILHDPWSSRLKFWNDLKLPRA